MQYRPFLLTCIIIMLATSFLHAQQKDTIVVKNDSIQLKQQPSTATAAKKTTAKDTVKVIKHIPRKASIRSALIPGWGQAYNKKYWKIPIVWGALGVTAAVFNFNLKQYQDINYAYQTLVNKDTPNYVNVKPEYKPFMDANDQNSLFNARSEVRRNIDYSVLIFILFWGLNVVDATVDAHLREFNVNSDLSFKIKPTYNLGTNTPGLSLAFDIHKGKTKMLALPESR